MLSVDRGDFCIDSNSAYFDRPQSIGFGATISAPHMHAWALELLKNNLKPGMKCLDIGSGSGYLSTCMAKMVGDQGWLKFAIFIDINLILCCLNF